MGKSTSDLLIEAKYMDFKHPHIVDYFFSFYLNIKANKSTNQTLSLEYGDFHLVINAYTITIVISGECDLLMTNSYNNLSNYSPVHNGYDNDVIVNNKSKIVEYFNHITTLLFEGSEKDTIKNLPDKIVFSPYHF